jgi:hypothetical protein
MARVKPRRSRRHDQLAGFFGRQSFDVREIIHRLVGEILARAYAASGKYQ